METPLTAFSNIYSLLCLLYHKYWKYIDIISVEDKYTIKER